jgi:hypothetical protein
MEDALSLSSQTALGRNLFTAYGLENFYNLGNGLPGDPNINGIPHLEAL